MIKQSRRRFLSELFTLPIIYYFPFSLRNLNTMESNDGFVQVDGWILMTGDFLERENL